MPGSSVALPVLHSAALPGPLMHDLIGKLLPPIAPIETIIMAIIGWTERSCGTWRGGGAGRMRRSGAFLRSVALSVIYGSAEAGRRFTALHHRRRDRALQCSKCAH